MKKHDHGTHMIWDGDWCACKVCEQQWELDLRRGWVPVGDTPKPTYKPKPKLKQGSKVRVARSGRAFPQGTKRAPSYVRRKANVQP